MCKCVVVSAIFALLGIAVLAIGLILGFAVFDVLIDDYIREVCIDVVVIVLIIIRSVFAQNNDNCGRRYKKSIKLVYYRILIYSQEFTFLSINMQLRNFVIFVCLLVSE